MNALLSRQLGLQAKISREYKLNHVFYDKTIPEVEQVIQRNKNFEKFKSSKLYRWQEKALREIFCQNNRQILWLYENMGKTGKTFLSQYLSYVFDFQLFDGVLSPRDITMKFDTKSHGVVFDVSRSSIANLDYHTLESIKNGHLITGKYASMRLIFDPKPIVVFSNSPPNISMLSEDRWVVCCIGSDPGYLHCSDEVPIFQPSTEFPMIQPPPIPNLSQNFDLKQYLSDKRMLSGGFCNLYFVF